MTTHQNLPAVVECIACGASIPRDAAREYDRFGDRWDRDGKTFEYLCKSCHRRECHHPRNGLEATLQRIAPDQSGAEAFVRAYYEQVERSVPDGDQ